MNIGQKILELRKNAKMTQEELAQELSVSRQTISKWELGETSPDLNQASKIVKLFEVSLDSLIGNDTKTLLSKKISNIEQLASIIIKILKVIGITLYIIIIISIICLGVYFYNKKDFTKEYQNNFTCTSPDNDITSFYTKANEDNTFSIIKSKKIEETFEPIAEYQVNSLIELVETLKVLKKTTIDNNGSTCR